MERRQIILIATLLAAVVGVLATIYFVFLRPDYAVLYEDLREADAAEIVAELEKQGIAYRLADNGHRILVPEGDADRARVVIAGSGIAMGGVVGFELFNDADMGLTEFAEKVNYQRALQGELARTIMMMDGIGFARVHLSLPERTLFRAARIGPKAAVTIQTAAGRTLDARQVEGIQRLVASAVAELPAHDVAVLDDKGDLISPAIPDGQAGAALDERGALEAYFRARAQGAAAKLLPGLPFEIRVTAQGWETGISVPDTQGEKAQDPPRERNFNLRVALRTEADLNDENRTLLRDAITAALALVPERGDVLRFETGPLGMAGDAQWGGNPALASAPAGHDMASPPPALSVDRVSLFDRIVNGWTLALLAVLGFGIALLLRHRARMNDNEQGAFADLLTRQLAAEEGHRHG